MKKIGTILKKISNTVAIVSFVGVALLMLLNVADVAINKISGQSIVGAYEISQCTLMCAVFASFAYGQVTKTHITMTLIIERLPGRAKFIPFFLCSAVSTVMAAILTYATFYQAGRQVASRAMSDILHFPLAPFYYVEAVCMVVFCAMLCYDTVLALMAIFRTDCAELVASDW